MGSAAELVYSAPVTYQQLEQVMSDQNQNAKDAGDGMADAIAATAVIAVVTVTLVYWLSGFPG